MPARRSSLDRFGSCPVSQGASRPAAAIRAMRAKPAPRWAARADDGAADQAAEGDPHLGDDGEDGVGEDVVEDGPALGQAFGAGDADEELALHGAVFGAVDHGEGAEIERR
jgi:hypothetical protein